MRHYRLGNDLMLRVALFDVSAEGLRQPHSLMGEVTMIATTKLDSVKLTVSSVVDNIITATFTGAEMRAEGVYTLTVAEKHGEHSRTIDICHAFELVGCACEASGETISNAATLDIESVVAMLPYAIDEVLDPQSTNAVQNRAVAQAVDALATEIPDVSEFVTKATLTASLSGKVDKVEGKGLSTNDFDNAAKAEVAKVEGKQDKLVVSTLGNGNIKVEGLGEFMAATPSGSPNHALYVAVGAKWNATTGLWSLNGISDLKATDMATIITKGNMSNNINLFNGQYANSTFRTNLWPYLYTVPEFSLTYMFRGNRELEVVDFAGSKSGATIKVTNMAAAFYSCNKLRQIRGTLICVGKTNTINVFDYCDNLEEVYVENLDYSIRIVASAKFKKECLLYMIQKAAPTSAITITVHADVYAWASTDPDVQAALSTQPLVTLISA